MLPVKLNLIHLLVTKVETVLAVQLNLHHLLIGLMVQLIHLLEKGVTTKTLRVHLGEMVQVFHLKKAVTTMTLRVHLREMGVLRVLYAGRKSPNLISMKR